MPEDQEESRKRLCPLCTEPMHSHKLGEVELDHCTSCACLWLDRGELKRVAASELGRDLVNDRRLWDDAERLKGNLSKAVCPDCRIELVELRHDVDSPTIEMCPRCHGVLLEKGELKALIAALSEEGPLDAIREALDGKTTVPEAAERLGTHFSDALLRMAAELEANHPYVSGMIKGFEQAIS